MKSPLVWLLVILVSPSLAIAAGAQLKPGQWEMSITMQMAGMPEIGPEQIAQMKQLGIEIPMFSSKPSVIQQCITQEQASLKKPIDTASNPNDQCSIKNYKNSGKSVSGDMVCTGEMKAQGRFEMTVASDISYRGKWSLKGVTADGQPIDQSSNISGKWIKAKCDAGIAAAP